MPGKGCCFPYQKLQAALSRLYPNNLVVTLDMKMIHEVLIKICEENGFLLFPPSVSWDRLCVPFGNILNRCIVPNTVTKSLHTEKYYMPDTKSFSIKSFPTLKFGKSDEDVKVL